MNMSRGAHFYKDLEGRAGPLIDRFSGYSLNWQVRMAGANENA